MNNTSDSRKNANNDMLFLSRMFYFTIHIFAWMLLFIYDNPYRRMVTNYELTEPILFAVIVFYSNYLLLTAGKNPGLCSDQNAYSKPQEVHLLEKQINDSQQCSLELQMHLDQDQDQVIDIQSEEQNQTIDMNTDSDLSPNKMKDQPQKEFCQICQHFKPYRTKHCHYCNACIPKFDHHCFWVGGCIGELNHRKFFLFLLVQTFVHMMLFNYFWEALDYYPYQTNSKDGIPIYSKEYGAYVIITIVATMLTFFTGGLLIYHSYLLLNGLTTWEHNKRDRISYLKVYPRDYHPFDYGFMRNVAQSLFHRNQVQDWNLPPIPQKIFNSKKESFNYFKNEYYSCC